ncbi:MAG: haloacid dehalogenase-like hydrolase [Cyanobacteria bacterium SBLK]|nr:haloacid dehalogenase-like hydrolase [Cyanobacteria bacterium SBLK]
MTPPILRKLAFLCVTCVLWLNLAGCTTTQAIATDIPVQEEIEYLPSWTDGTETKTAITDFVADVTTPGSANFVAAKDRVAVFDNDGTLWGEYPNYVQAFFFESHGSGIGEETESYINAAGDFVETENNTEFDSPYVDLIYQPMVELLDYLRANEFQVYICSGGEIDFIRGFAEEYYGIPPENIVGSALTTTFDNTTDPPVLLRSDELVPPANDKAGKPVGIERYIGKKPILAVGNSNGDLQMLEYTDDSQGNDLMLLLRHDDLARERYEEVEDPSVDCSVNDDSDPDNDVPDGPGFYCHTDKAVDKANSEDDWYLISVANDFDKVFLGTELP